MRLFKLTASTVFRRKTWAVCAFAVLILPFLLARISSGTENPALLKPALAQATWAMTWLAAILWGFFAAAKSGEALSRSGLGEYFQSCGVSPTRQLFAVWAALFTFVAPLAFGSALVSILGASPALPAERTMWIGTNLQYALLFALVIAPLLALAISVASRFGSLTGFLVSSGLTVYGLYGVGYLQMTVGSGDSSLLTWLWNASPHYHFADPTERLRYKLGAIDWSQFPMLLGYFAGIALLYAAISRLLFRTKAIA